MSTKIQIVWRIYMAYLLVTVLAIAIFIQTVNIQTLEGAYWRNMADSLTTGFKNIEAMRGNIYSDDGSLISTSLPIYEVRFDVNSSSLSDKLFYGNIDSLAICLSNYFNDKSHNNYRRDLINARVNNCRYYLIRKNLSYTDLKIMKTWPIFRLGQYKGGFIVEQKSKRVQPFKLLASRTIGYVRETVHPVGIEGAYNKHLRGVSGKRLMQKISGGVWIPINDDNELDPQDGKDIISTINVNLQDVAENALLKQLIIHNADHGCVVLMEVATGEIKAIANLGRDTISNQYSEKYNYAVGESTEPGSTFKLASMLALLEDDYVQLTDTIDIEGGVKQYFDKEMRDSKIGEYDKLTVQEAFEFSSNVGISKIMVEKYAQNPQKFINRLKKIGLAKPTGITITGEGIPSIKDPKEKDWSGVTLPWTSIGYEVLFTPLQILTLYNAIANNGWMVKPMLVKEIIYRGETINSFHTELLNNNKICSPSTLKILQYLLEGVVEKGTAKNLKAASYKIAGKTGTAKFADKLHGYMKNVTYQSSFVGYFPADKPKYSCIVVVNAPSNNVYYGNVVAGPIFKEIADKVFAADLNMNELLVDNSDKKTTRLLNAKTGNRLDICTIYNTIGVSVVSNGETEWVSAKAQGASVELVERKIIENLVPNVTGMGLKDAIYLLENSGLKVNVIGSGIVRKQSLKVGTKVMNGREIIIELG